MSKYEKLLLSQIITKSAARLIIAFLGNTKISNDIHQRKDIIRQIVINACKDQARFSLGWEYEKIIKHMSFIEKETSAVVNDFLSEVNQQ